MRRISILDLPLDCLTFEEAIRRCDQLIGAPRLKWAVTLNPEIAVFAQKDSELKRAIQEADLVTADGTGLLWGATRLQDKKSESFLVKWFKTFGSGVRFFFSSSYRRRVIPKRVAGVDLVKILFALCAKRGYRVFLLGGSEGIALRLKEKLKEKYPRIQVVGAMEGFSLAVENNQLEVLEKGQEDKVFSEIQSAKPHLLLVAFGPPKQERWIYQNQDKLRDVKLAIGVGGTFDFLTGRTRRAPRFVQKMGLEFIWRLFTQPKRFGRMITTIPKFVRLITNND